MADEILGRVLETRKVSHFLLKYVIGIFCEESSDSVVLVHITGKWAVIVQGAFSRFLE